MSRTVAAPSSRSVRFTSSVGAGLAEEPWGSCNERSERDAQPNNLPRNLSKALQIELDILEMNEVPNHGDARKHHGKTNHVGTASCFGIRRKIATVLHQLVPDAW